MADFATNALLHKRKRHGIRELLKINLMYWKPEGQRVTSENFLQGLISCLPSRQ